MSRPTPETLRPRRLGRIELVALADGRSEASLEGGRRVQLSSDARWLLEQLDGHSTLADLALRLSARFGRALSSDDAAELLDRTLVAHRLASMSDPGAGGARSVPLARSRRWTLVPAPVVRRVSATLAPLASPAVSLALLASALASLGVAFARALPAGARAWLDPLAWTLALPVLAASVLAHELGHAVALARAGGTPGEIALQLSRFGLRCTSGMGGLRTLPPRARAGVDVAGVLAQALVAGAVAAIALALRTTPPGPALAVPLAFALLDLVPVPGSDGRWLLDDLADRDPGDAIVRRISPARWLSRLSLRLAARAAANAGRGRMRERLHLMPVFLSASFPDWPPARLKRHAVRHVEMLAVAERDHDAIPRGARTDEARRLAPLRALRREGRGVVVCAMHMGPYQFVPDVLLELGWRVLCYVAPGQQRRFAAGWRSGATTRGAALEVLSPASVRDAVRAVRGVRGGAALFVLMDGQRASARELHRTDVRFLGHELWMRTGPALLAARANAPIVLAASSYRGVARRVVEFSQAFAPPAEDSDAAIGARTAELYAWFEPHVARAPEQWDGWTWPLTHWRATGGAPTASARELEDARQRVRSALGGSPRGARLAAERTRVHWAEMNGEHLIVDGPSRRVLVADPLACRVLDAALRRERVAGLPRRVAAPPEAVADHAARLVLAGLATIET
ncbi:MAG TPA: hypothetical protein VMH61_03420 [Candidatus Acidoferrales bacterium]|nr:hypothetical protein [Candidatus Acidoferrales bacterium]